MAQIRWFSLGFIWFSVLCHGSQTMDVPCLAPSAPLSVYLGTATNFPNGCDVGYVNFRFLEFGKLNQLQNGGYSLDPAGGTINPDNLMVVPRHNSPLGGISFHSEAFRSNFTTPELYYISITADPPPILVGEFLSMEDATFDSPALQSFAAFSAQDYSEPFVQVTDYICANSLFARTTTGPDLESNMCATGPTTETSVPYILSITLDNPTGSLEFEQPVPLTASHIYIYLSGDLTNSSFTGFWQAPIADPSLADIPEPFTSGLVAGGIGLLALARRRFGKK